VSIDEPRNHVHAAMAADDQHPGWSKIPEVRVAERIGSLISRYMQSPYLTDDFWTAVGGKIAANRGVLRAVFDELDADPKRLRERGSVLRQQQTASLEDRDYWLQEAAIAKAAWREACANAEACGADHRDLYDPDSRGEDEDDARIAAEARDEKARDQAPRVVA
jgi:hypothetical protein